MPFTKNAALFVVLASAPALAAPKDTAIDSEIRQQTRAALATKNPIGERHQAALRVLFLRQAAKICQTLDAEPEAQKKCQAAAVADKLSTGKALCSNKFSLDFRIACHEGVSKYLEDVIDLQQKGLERAANEIQRVKTTDGQEIVPHSEFARWPDLSKEIQIKLITAPQASSAADNPDEPSLAAPAQ